MSGHSMPVQKPGLGTNTCDTRSLGNRCPSSRVSSKACRIAFCGSVRMLPSLVLKQTAPGLRYSVAILALVAAGFLLDRGSVVRAGFRLGRTRDAKRSEEMRPTTETTLVMNNRPDRGQSPAK